MARYVIVGGADINNYETIKAKLRPDDFFVFCDSGLKHLESLGVTPGLIVGDFDSHENPGLDVETIILPREKDDTDTMYAVKECMKRGGTEFLIIGAVGARFDHTMGNIFVLYLLYANKLKASIIDDYSEMQIVSAEPVFIDDSYSYFSLLNMDRSAHKITIKNAKYPLEDAEIPYDFQYGISNEVLPGKTSEVRVKEGWLLLVKVF